MKKGFKCDIISSSLFGHQETNLSINFANLKTDSDSSNDNEAAHHEDCTKGLQETWL